MANNKRRERLLSQLTRMREIEHRAAASDAAQALDVSQRSEQLAQRAQSLAAAYVNVKGLETAQDLSCQLLSGKRLREVAAHVEKRAVEARTLAEVRMHEAHRAKRKLEQLEERKVELRKDQAMQLERKNVHGGKAKRPIGTDRE